MQLQAALTTITIEHRVAERKLKTAMSDIECLLQLINVVRTILSPMKITIQTKSNTNKASHDVQKCK